ncbi:DNA primase [Chitinivibrio alkaliphilus]|uniref:DNA primase n=1 Tax=Chitinivibrio alkaliphilus ACht1 TaxID=1313304 RepID=U7DB99_9BACT|nr:DNA primase [Chitinivibrio alkaliphilus]ERP38833.1 DNA primase [Chitinivibrio alkaliphilus ACht1]
MDSSRFHEVKEQIRGSIDIVSFIERYIPLRRAGENYKGLCPFHNEKSPSFVVSPHKEIYHCFGCGAGGDLFAFIMDIEGCSFREALEIAANEAGIDLQKHEIPGRRRGDSPNYASTVPKDFLYRANSYGAHYFYANIRKSERAISFFKHRGLSAEIVREFKLGYAPDHWSDFSQVAQEDGYSRKVLIAAGLSLSPARGSSIYDRFRHRIMFPIFDVSGRVIAFGGRALEDDQQPKYVNSPETEIYRKNKTLYGLNFARPFIRDSQEILIVEGYMDMISLYARGVCNVVATCGTALTVEQGRILRRFAPRVYLIFDGDSAGIAAAKRAIETLISLELDLRIAVLPQGEDPDTLIQEKGKEGFLYFVHKSQEALGFYMEFLKKSLDTTTPQGRSQAVEHCISLISRVDNQILASEYAREVAFMFSVDESLVISRLTGKKQSGNIRRVSSEDVFQHNEGEGFETTEEGSLLHFLVQYPEYVERYAYRIQENLFIDPTHKEVFSCILKHGKELNKNVGAVEKESLRKLLSYLFMKEIAVQQDHDEWIEYKLSRLENSLVARRKNRLVEEIARARDADTKQALLAELNSLTVRKSSEEDIRGEQ